MRYVQNLRVAEDNICFIYDGEEIKIVDVEAKRN